MTIFPAGQSVRERAVEAMARGAWIGLQDRNHFPLIREDWMDDDYWQEMHIDRMASWPEETGFSVTADDFRRAATAALDAALEVLSEPDEAMADAARLVVISPGTDDEHFVLLTDDQRNGVWSAMLATVKAPPVEERGDG